jgi:hypothetical protein
MREQMVVAHNAINRRNNQLVYEYNNKQGEGRWRKGEEMFIVSNHVRKRTKLDPNCGFPGSARCMRHEQQTRRGEGSAHPVGSW